MLALALLAGALSSCGTGEDSAGGCIAVLELGGVSYYGHSDPEEPVPTTGTTVDAVVPACIDTGGEPEPDEEVLARAIEGVPVDTAVLLEGTVYIREGARMPVSAATWFDSVSCRGAQAFRLAGRWEGVSEPHAPHFDGRLDVPYEVLVQVDDGFEQYVGSSLEIQVVGSTDPALALADLDRLHTARLGVTVRCREGEFLALSVRLQ